MAQSRGQTAATVDVITTETLTDSASLALDDTLRASPAFSLFRRSNSILANPTAQGVSLRGIGPSGASRTLVLLDGIPLNDPFGGWVTWSKIPRLSVQRAEIVRGSGSGVWGNAALGGTVQLFAPPAADDHRGALALEGGSQGIARGEFVSQVAAPAQSMWRVGGRWFQSDGPWQYAPNQRGPIDRRFDSEHMLAHADFRARLRSGFDLSLGGRWFDEERGNGTPFQRNQSQENAAHARLAGELRPGLGLDVLAYAQRQHFASGFSAVDVSRSGETPSLDQFDVPATAWGGAIVATWETSTDTKTVLGADARTVSGETHEDFFFSNGEFLRRRFAGGDQTTGGIFLGHQRPLSGNFSMQSTARLDRWIHQNGHRHEWTKATGAVLRDETFPDASGTEFNPNLGLVWRASGSVTWRASAYRSFRIPTLNELYRPFRVGNVATEANAALRRESATGAEVGCEYERNHWRVRAGAFQSNLHDAVANVTLSRTPALTQRQRLNLDAIRVRGLEASVSGRLGPMLSFAIDYLLLDARVVAAPVAPDIEGRRLAQVPRHTATLHLGWRPDDRWRINLNARAVSAQYEDDENALRLAPFVTVDLAVRRALTTHQSLQIAVENALDARVETTRTVAGLVSLGSGRSVRAAWSLTW